MTLSVSDFDYDLPADRIAQSPAQPRDRSRLMVLDRADGQRSHHTFRELPSLLREGDVLVMNDTFVIPARFFCRRRTGGRIEGLFLREIRPGLWEVALKNASRCKTQEELEFINDPSLIGRLEDRLGGGFWRMSVGSAGATGSPAAGAIEILERIGTTPLPPYIRRESADGPGLPDDPGAASPSGREDRRAYQTIYASRPGAVAAPTAGLHFTQEVLDGLEEKGIDRVTVTLHVGPGTFQPVKAERLEHHRMHAEWYELSAPAAESLNIARRQGRPIVAVGTTSVRVLETAAIGLADNDAPIPPGKGWTDLFIYPPAEFALVDAMLTNFHLPRSTLLMLTAAFCRPGSTAGITTILDACAEAVRREYRFYSYGDAMLIR